MYKQALLLFVMLLNTFSFSLKARCLPAYPSGNNSYTVPYSSGGALRDSIPPPPEMTRLQKVLNAFKFKKNIQAKEKGRILDVLKNTFLEDSVMANAQEIRSLNKALSDSLHRQFDSLVKLLDNIPVYEPDTIYAGTATPAQTDIQQLTDKILPLIRERIREEDLAKSNPGKLNLLRLFRGRPRRSPDTVYTENAAYRLTREAGIYCYYHPGSADYLDYNFDVIDALLVDGYIPEARTGFNTQGTDWVGDRLLRVAANAGCKVLLIVRTTGAGATSAFLRHPSARQVLVHNVCRLLRNEGLDGVNIMLEGLTAPDAARFISFVQSFSDSLKNGLRDKRLIVTVPAFDENGAYDVNMLDRYADGFIIDFTLAVPSSVAGPLVPLTGTGKNSLSFAVSRYLNSNAPPGKFIAGLPYYGVRWNIREGRANDRISGFPVYDDIARADAPLNYDMLTHTVYRNFMNSDSVITRQTWFDDRQTLFAKYNYILQNRLGGLAIYPYHNNIGYSVIWQGLAAKFIGIDTLYDALKPPLLPLHPVSDSCHAYADELYQQFMEDSLSFLDCWDTLKTISQKGKKIMYLFEHPCQCSFANDTVGKVRFHFPDSLVNRQSFSLSKKEHIKVQVIVTRFLIRINLLLLFILLGIAAFYIYNIRRKGTPWKARKITAVALIVLVNIFVLTGFMYLFISDAIPDFGTATHGEECYDMPFETILFIIFCGVVIGTLVMRFLIFPVIRRTDKP